MGAFLDLDHLVLFIKATVRADSVSSFGLMAVWAINQLGRFNFKGRPSFALAVVGSLSFR